MNELRQLVAFRPRAFSVNEICTVQPFKFRWYIGETKTQREMAAEAEAEEEVKAVLREAFGDSSSESDGEPSLGLRQRASSGETSTPLSIFGDGHRWEQISEINGLWICSDFLSADQQSSLLSSFEQDGYLAETSRNQAMRFGDLPPWAIELSCIVRENIVLSSYFLEAGDPMNRKEQCVFPSEFLWREPLFNQLIVNIYHPGEGIAAHVDLMRFEDGIAIVSLESPCVMHFSPDSSRESKTPVGESKIPVLLTPGSLVLMWGDARFLWKHEINRKPGFQIWEGEEINQKRRTSITLRRLCPIED